MAIFGLKQRFLMLIVIVLIAFAAVFSLQVFMLDKQKNSWQELKNQAMARQELLLRMRSEFGYGALIHNFKNYVLRGDEKYRLRVVNNHLNLSSIVNNYSQLGNLTVGEQQALESILQVADQYLKTTVMVRKMIDQGESVGQIDSVVKISDSPAIEGFIALGDRYQELTVLYTHRFEQESGSVAQYSILILVVALLVILVSALALYRYVVRRIGLLQQAVHNIACGEGDLSSKVEVEGSDEFAQVAQEFNIFIDQMRKLVMTVRSLSGDISVSLKQIHQNAEGNAARSSRQKDETESLAAAVEEMANTAHMVADNTNTAVNAVDHAQREFDSGVQSLSHSVESMVELASDVRNASDVIDHLKQRSDDIGEIVTVIGGIAEQTNLLALNAAIEAARAGDQGRGFAVVADEVRTLAGRTQQSTEQIRSMISELQDGTAKAVSVMDNSEARSESSVALVKKAEHSLQEISAEINRISELNFSISSASDQQSTVTDELNSNIHSIFQLSEDTALAVATNKAAIAEMKLQSKNLDSVVQRFKL
ncbi:methyl-accepting chemotaxis protein [Amphritea sp. HPY]|uniref:methyl-accepting chemotaxis protein n=1 Tax=Amphritea sp. HPY TaxID=3421652 RepID=UPI003D7E46C5